MVPAVPLPQAPTRITELCSGKHRAFTFNILVLGQNTTQGLGHEVTRAGLLLTPLTANPGMHSLGHSQATAMKLLSLQVAVT